MKYAVLFRGINVGGKNIVKMDDLKRLLIDSGLRKVKTYIQSGNVILETALDEASLREIIHARFAERFGFDSDVMIRSIDEIGALIDQIPFSAEEITAVQAADPQVEHVYIYFLNRPPEQKQMDDICREYAGPDKLRAGKREAYLLCHQSVRKSTLALRAAKVWDTATVRNWNTVKRLQDMLAGL